MPRPWYLLGRTCSSAWELPQCWVGPPVAAEKGIASVRAFPIDCKIWLAALDRDHNALLGGVSICCTWCGRLNLILRQQGGVWDVELRVCCRLVQKGCMLGIFDESQSNSGPLTADCGVPILCGYFCLAPQPICKRKASLCDVRAAFVVPSARLALQVSCPAGSCHGHQSKLAQHWQFSTCLPHLLSTLLTNQLYFQQNRGMYAAG